jgi:NADH-quinone oxidoreductase subunit M
VAAVLPVASTSSQLGFPYLTTIVLLPAVAAVVVAALPGSRPRLCRLVGLGTALAVLGLSVAMAARFQVGVAGFQMLSRHRWIAALGISWNLGVDGISLFLVLLCAVLFPLALGGAGAREDPKGFVAWMLVLEAACLGSFLSLDLLVFFLFFELTLVPVYFLIGHWGHQRRQYAAIKFFLYTLLGSAFLLVGILGLVFVHQRQTGVVTFDLLQLASTALSGSTGVLLFLAFTAAFAVKAPVFPLHTWSPDAYASAPAAGSVVLAGVMAKLGTYGIVRFDLTLFPKASSTLAPLLLTLGVVGILYGAAVAAVQRDLKRLVAYSSLAHLGFIVLGLFAFTRQGLSGGVLQMVNHGIYTAALFLLIGWIYERRRTWQIPELSGLQKAVPVMAAAFTVFMLASIGLPGLNGFVGEFLILIGTFVAHRWWAVLGATGVILAAVYLLWAYKRVFHGSPDPQSSLMADLGWREGLVVVPLVALVVFLGVYPRPVLDRIGPSANAVVARVHAASGTQEPAVAAGKR